ncbi:hypothetical protein [Nostoc sp. C057]|uniref:hypothetical protein n=1 Tax=Nostoc sp. C057 TaxID=2576903 RepID=UPI00277B5C58|nr:hypothetical protein [Nostoc sp. C057]
MVSATFVYNVSQIAGIPAVPLLRYLEKRSTWIFVFYRLAMGVFLIVAVMAGWLQN